MGFELLRGGEMFSEPEPVPAAPAPVPDEPVRAWKCARLSTDGKFMPLMFPGHPYPAAETRFECRCLRTSYLRCPPDHLERFPEHEFPGFRQESGMGHGCGHYAVKTLADACSYISYQFPLDPTVHVMEVELYGHIIEHKYGYRAEYQRVLSVRVSRDVLYTYGGLLVPGGAIYMDDPSREYRLPELSSLFGTEFQVGS